MPSQGRRAITLLGFVDVVHIPIDELTKKIRFLAITIILVNELEQKKLSFLIVTVGRALLGQATYPCAWIPICFLHSHQCIKAHSPLGQADYLLREFLYAFCMTACFPMPYRCFSAACLCFLSCMLACLPACRAALASAADL